MLWFLRNSWKYLGCDHGAGRWRARLKFARGLCGAFTSYRAACQRDGNGLAPRRPA